MSLHSTLRNQAINLPAADAPKKTPRRLPANQTLWISIATLASVVALWWAVTALQLIGPLFLPAPQQVLHQLWTIASPQGFMDATLWQHLAASLEANFRCVVGGSGTGGPYRDRHGAEQ
ncbi:taurine transport system permease protein [Yersinia pestis D182038]|nr:taurine transport system permease protein [Yersinia pestis D182038]